MRNRIRRHNKQYRNECFNNVLILFTMTILLITCLIWQPKSYSLPIKQLKGAVNKQVEVILDNNQATRLYGKLYEVVSEEEKVHVMVESTGRIGTPTIKTMIINKYYLIIRNSSLGTEYIIDSDSIISLRIKI